MARFKSNYSFAIVILLVGFLVIIGEASLKGRKNQPARKEGSNEIWTIGVETLNNRELYVDPLSGEAKGFYVDLIDAVCREAKQDCRLVFDRFTNCWDGMQVGGYGLFNFYYDACAGWLRTVTRTRTFKFTDAFSPNQNSLFAVKPGNPDNFDWRNLTGKKIGFGTGYAASPLCIAQHQDLITGVPLPDTDIVYYDDYPTMFQGVADGEVDAGFLGSITESDLVDFLDADNSIFCALDGLGLMMRKDNRLVDWWNPAWQKLLRSDEYQKICANLIEEHGSQPGPNPEDICLEV